MENYIFKSEINWSLLRQGFTIPVKEHNLFARKEDGTFLKKGEQKEVTIFLAGDAYKAVVIYQNTSKESKRKLLQLRYNVDNRLPAAMQRYFYKSYEYIRQNRKLEAYSEKRQHILLPEGKKEYLKIYATTSETTYIFEPLFTTEFENIRTEIIGHKEREIEEEMNSEIEDDKASIFTTEKLVKVRKLNHSIGLRLKRLYNYQCQICGKSIGGEYGTHIVEAHHIDYFMSSLNNNSSNQLIVCPNHHSIIHDCNPIFDRINLTYVYPNGYKERLKLNEHL